MKIRLAIIYAKIIKTVLVILNRRGGSLPGKLASKLCIKPLRYLKYPDKIILITGTNGKTTTTNMAYQMLRANYKTVIGNYNGDNLIAGITTLMLTNTDLSLKVKADAIVIEVDEITVPTVLNDIPVTHIVINNLFRDQLDRAGEMETIIRKFEKALITFDGTLILNGDDPNVARLGYKKQATYFGVAKCESSTEKSSEASEGKYCFNCNTALSYDYYHYSHIGNFHCSACDFGQYERIVADKIGVNYSKFCVDDYCYTSPYTTLYAFYNCMAVIALGQKLSITPSLIQTVFSRFEMNDGRMESFNLNRPILLNLIKNPTGANEVIKYIDQETMPKSIWLILNDNGQDGRDVSWIYDVDFERLLSQKISSITCSGTRAYDMALCIKYHGYNGVLNVFESDEAACEFFKAEKDKGYILVTYTALQKVRQLLKRAN